MQPLKNAEMYDLLIIVLTVLLFSRYIKSEIQRNINKTFVGFSILNVKNTNTLEADKGSVRVAGSGVVG